MSSPTGGIYQEFSFIWERSIDHPWKKYLHLFKIVHIYNILRIWI